MVVEPGRPVKQIVVAHQEAGGPPGVRVERGDLVGGEHLREHAVVAFGVVERFDDPVAPVPDVLLCVADLRAQAVPVAVPPDVHPVPAPALAVMRVGQQPVDDPLPGVGPPVVEKVAQLGHRRRQADQVPVESPELGRLVRLGQRFEAAMLSVVGEKGVDRVRERGVRDSRGGPPCGDLEGPVAARILGPVFHRPAPWRPRKSSGKAGKSGRR